MNNILTIDHLSKKYHTLEGETLAIEDISLNFHRIHSNPSGNGLSGHFSHLGERAEQYSRPNITSL